MSYHERMRCSHLDDELTRRIRAAASHGAIRRRTLTRLGVSQDAVTARLAAGSLTPRGHGIYVIAGLADEWTDLVLLLARSSWLAASFEAAAACYGWDGFDRLPPAGRGPAVLVAPWTSRADLRPYRRNDLWRSDLRVVDRMRVTAPLWTLTHLGERSWVSRDRLEQAVEAALRRRQVDENDLWTRAAVPDGPGPALLAEVLRSRGRGTSPTGSALETMVVQRVLRPYRIEVVGRQVDVFEGTSWHGRPDFLLPGWTILEVDGSQHREESHQVMDLDRDLRFAALDLDVIRAPSYEVRAYPHKLGARISRIVARRSRTRTEPPPFDGRAIRLPGPGPGPGMPSPPGAGYAPGPPGREPGMQPTGSRPGAASAPVRRWRPP